MKRLAFSLLAILATAYFVGYSPTNAYNSKARSVTYTRDVASILNRDCAVCHHPGDIGPMSLLSYKEVRPWARSIKEKVATREMPPWPADPHYGQFANERRLSQSAIDTVVAWVDQGAVEGDSKDLPPVPQFTEGWRIGKPDAAITMPEEV